MMDSIKKHTAADHVDEGVPQHRFTPENPLLVDRWFARLPVSRVWIVATIGVILLLIPAILAGWEENTDYTLVVYDRRAQFVYALIIVCSLMVIPAVEKRRENVVQALRPVTRLDDSAFQAVVNRASVVSPTRELLAFGAGMALGLTVNILFEPLGDDPSPMAAYAYLSRIGIFGVFAWAFFVLPFGIKVTNELLNQPTNVDPFDLTAFEPIGRQSLLLSLALLGGVLLSLLSASVQDRSLWAQYIIVYSTSVSVSVFLLFWSMRTVHQLLAETKRRHLDEIEGNIAQAYYDLKTRIADKRDTHAVATELNALVAAKQQLRETRTWPFDTEMVSTLSIAVLIPLFVGLARIVAALLDR